MHYECAHEHDVLDAIASGRWPDRAGTELFDHVQSCRICADVAEVAGAFALDRDGAWDEAAVPPASLVWWRAQIRAREEAARTAARPILIAQGVAAVVIVVLLLVFAPVMRSALESGAASLAATATEWFSASPADLSQSAPARSTTFTLLAAGVWVLLAIAPLALYLAAGDD